MTSVWRPQQTNSFAAMSTVFPSLESFSHYDTVLHVCFWTSSTPILALELDDFPVHYHVHLPSYPVLCLYSLSFPWSVAWFTSISTLYLLMCAMLAAEVLERERQEQSSRKCKATSARGRGSVEGWKVRFDKWNSFGAEALPKKLYNYPVLQIRINKIAIIFLASFLTKKWCLEWCFYQMMFLPLLMLLQQNAD